MYGVLFFLLIYIKNVNKISVSFIKGYWEVKIYCVYNEGKIYVL